MVEHGDDRTGVGQGPPDRIGERAEPAGLADAEPPPLEPVRCLPHRFHLADHGDRGCGIGAARTTRRSAAMVSGPQTPSTVMADVALELLERVLGAGAEDAVDPAGVEAERAEVLLELADVVAPQHRGREIEQPVTEAVAGLDERGPGLWSADPVGPQAAALLEAVHGALGRGAVGARLVAAGVVAERA